LVNADNFDVQVTDFDAFWNGNHGTAGFARDALTNYGVAAVTSRKPRRRG
jgi:hypothetical protein